MNGRQLECWMPKRERHIKQARMTRALCLEEDYIIGSHYRTIDKRFMSKTAHDQMLLTLEHGIETMVEH
jgi:hypothetical protein